MLSICYIWKSMSIKMNKQKSMWSTALVPGGPGALNSYSSLQTFKRALNVIKSHCFAPTTPVILFKGAQTVIQMNETAVVIVSNTVSPPNLAIYCTCSGYLSENPPLFPLCAETINRVSSLCGPINVRTSDPNQQPKKPQAALMWSVFG